MALALFPLVPILLGAVFIRGRQAGAIVKKFGHRSLPPGHLIALEGEAGYQADTFAPGLHFGYWRGQYRILKVPVTVVPQGEIALVVAAAGEPNRSEHIVRIFPDVAVSGATGNSKLVDGLLGGMLRDKNNGSTYPKQN